VNPDQGLILGILAVMVAMFLWGRWRHDMVAAGALLACVLAGLVAPAEAFVGFGHPAVVTVACVLVLSRGLQTSGAVDALARAVLPAGAGPTLSIAALTGLGALLSGFMNNVGALALLMPVAVQLAGRLELPPGRVLMPLAFGSILGGTTTLIGTPPNLIVSGFRENQAGLGGFGMFDFTAVGAPLTLAGLAFIALIGWRLVPARKPAGIEGFETGAYLTEARVPEDGKSVGLTLRELDQALDATGAQVVGLVRNDMRLTAPGPRHRLRGGDILVIEADADALAKLLSDLGLKLEESKRPAREDEAASAGDKPDGTSGGRDEKEKKAEAADEIALMELAVLPGSTLAGRSASDIQLRTRYGLNLLAVSRQGHRATARLRSLALRAGDLMLMQGPPDGIAEFAADNGCVPLAERELRIPNRRKAITATFVMLASVGVAALGLLPAAVAFLGGVLASMALRTVPPRTVYEAVDWPVVVLLATLLPVAGAMQTTGAADLVARLLLDFLARGDAVIGLVVILVTTMILTDLMNNAATAAVMAPIGLGAATQLGVNPDTFLMAVAVGASCAFLTPIGHQNNTLILGPGGLRFGDYWRIGLPLDALVIAAGVPALLLAWPL
jgi:di/tricarboxylate transporter